MILSTKKLASNLLAGTLFGSLINLGIGLFTSLIFVLLLNITSNEQIYSFPYFVFTLVGYSITWFATGFILNRLFYYPYYISCAVILTMLTVDTFFSHCPLILLPITVLVYLGASLIGVKISKNFK